MLVTAIVCYALETCQPRKVYVVDGDTIKLGSQSIRIEGIDAPELKGDCANEKSTAQLAKYRLVTLLGNNADGHLTTVVVTPSGVDRYKRTLASVTADNVDVGEVLMKEGLARKWTKKWDRKAEPWCAAPAGNAFKPVEYLRYLNYLK